MYFQYFFSPFPFRIHSNYEIGTSLKRQSTNIYRMYQNDVMPWLDSILPPPYPLSPLLFYSSSCSILSFFPFSFFRSSDFSHFLFFSNFKSTSFSLLSLSPSPPNFFLSFFFPLFSSAFSCHSHFISLYSFLFPPLVFFDCFSVLFFFFFFFTPLPFYFFLCPSYRDFKACRRVPSPH